MSNKPYDRELINQRERPLSSDLNIQRSYVDLSSLETLRRQLQYRAFVPAAVVEQSDASVDPPSGFLSDGFMVRPGAGLSVALSAGLGFWNDATQGIDIGSPAIIGVDDLAAIKPLVLSGVENIAVPANASGNPRIDLIEVKLNRTLGDSAARDVLNLVSRVFEPTPVLKTMSYALDGTTTFNGAGAINYKTGVPGAVPVAPVTDAGYIPIGYVRVPNGAVAIAENQIQDFRKILFPGGASHIGLIVDVVIAGGNSVTKIIRASTPPGVRVWGIGNASPQLYLGIQVGDANDFLGAGGGCLSGVANGKYDNGGGNLIVATFGASVLVVAGGTQQGVAAAAVPPAPLAVDQPYVEMNFPLICVSNAGPIIVVPDGTYRMTVDISIGRS